MNTAPKHWLLAALAALALAAAIWLPCLHLFFRPRLDQFLAADGLAPQARKLAARHLELWRDSALREQELARMRGSNAEWDFMGRTFLVLALANMGLREPALEPACLEIMDRIIDETLRLERENGIHYFLMDYSRTGQFAAKAGRSLFEDGEIALMLAARRLLEEKPEYKPLLAARVEAMTGYMQESPVLSGESYPNECWMFCNSVALAAMRAADALDGTDHSEFINRWLETAKRSLVDAKTGLLISSYTFDGQPLDGPEGSSIWMVAHCLQLVDPRFAADQYARAKKEVSASFLGFGYAKEWPASWKGPADVDSGPIIPVLEISAGSSGLAILAAAAFGDRDYLAALLTTLNFAAFPVEDKTSLKFCASNQVGDAVMLYALVCGPLWAEIEKRAAAAGGFAPR